MINCFILDLFGRCNKLIQKHRLIHLFINFTRWTPICYFLQLKWRCPKLFVFKTVVVETFICYFHWTTLTSASVINRIEAALGLASLSFLLWQLFYLLNDMIAKILAFHWATSVLNFFFGPISSMPLLFLLMTKLFVFTQGGRRWRNELSEVILCDTFCKITISDELEVFLRRLISLWKL